MKVMIKKDNVIDSDLDINIVFLKKKEKSILRQSWFLVD